jgi:hypothetical protein
VSCVRCRLLIFVVEEVKGVVGRRQARLYIGICGQLTCLKCNVILCAVTEGGATSEAGQAGGGTE